MPLGSNMPIRLADTHQLYIAANKGAVGVLWVHRHMRQAFFAKHRFLQILNVKANVQVVHLLT